MKTIKFFLLVKCFFFLFNIFVLNKTALCNGNLAISFGINSTFPNLDNNMMTWERELSIFGETFVNVAQKSRVEMEGKRGFSIMASYEYNVSTRHMVIGRLGGHYNKFDVGYFHLNELDRDGFEVSMYTIYMDLLAGRRLGKTSLNGPFILGGARIGIPFSLDTKQYIANNEVNEDLKRYNIDTEMKSVVSYMNYGLVAGIGYDFSALNSNLRIIMEYYYAISNIIGENVHFIEGGRKYLNMSDNDLRVNHFLISIGIKL